MKARITIILRYALFWLGLFALGRFLFLSYQFENTSKVPLIEIFLIFVNGFRLDSTTTSYILIFYSTILLATAAASNKTLIYITRCFTFILLSVICFLTVSDLELYRNWEYRIDASVLPYLKTPQFALASTKLWLLIMLILSAGVLIFFSYIVYKNLVEKKISQLISAKWWHGFTLIPIILILIIPARGSFGIAPINTSTVYFSKNRFSNHATINTVWYFGKSLLLRNEDELENFMGNSDAEKIVSDLLEPQLDKAEPFVYNNRPNILILVLESFSASIIESLGGVPEATPRFHELEKEGIMFTNCYASGNRSDKGLTAILSGYPAQSKTSIMLNNSKAEKLPHLSHELKKLGYSTGFYYGGDINFANMKSYFMNGKYDNLVTLNDFSKNSPKGKWGIHDEIVYNRLFQDLKKSNEPFFQVMFTLSNHEPFEVPINPKFKGNQEEDLFMNSAFYSDSCLGDFISKSKKEEWWDNSLVILIADHGSRILTNSAHGKHHIPMLWLGGALVEKDTTINTLVSQIDIPLMIGNQLGEDFKEFKFSKDPVRLKQSFVYYTFREGFAFINSRAEFIWVNGSQKYCSILDDNDTTLIQGKAFRQYATHDFLMK